MTGRRAAKVVAAASESVVEGESPSKTRLRLFIARLTPNSVRAEQNIRRLLEELIPGEAVDLEIVDVFTHSKRAITDGVIVTPTVLWLRDNERVTIIGDLTDTTQLRLLLQSAADQKC